MTLRRPGRAGALMVALAVSLAVELASTGVVLLRPIPDATPRAPAQPAPAALQSLARAEGPRVRRPLPGPAALDPGGPDAPGITTLASS